MIEKPSLRELLDACRADQHDPQRPELAAELAPLARELQANAELQQAAEKSERFDRSVRAALDDVALPAGLLERMLTGCEAAVVAPAEPLAEATATSRRFSRRQAIALFAAAASLLIAVMGAWLFGDWWNRPRPVSNDQLAQSAMTWLDQSGPAAQWSTAAAPAKEFPLDAALVYRPVRWRYLDAAKKDAVVYEMRHESQRALLFVYKLKQPHPNVGSYPYSALTASGGVSLGAWQRGGMVYVLAVVGGNGRRPVDTFVRRPKFT
ncbi:hypothetical protein [Anatilimnocola floriformis]|uniref:hypothetical protein n=1 Tax=Anatilimnocola floriformis TaxID=2948575 RepID=UPI0020C5277D|nr:hypothetical protein [Anatilimnocola floriformis]